MTDPALKKLRALLDREEPEREGIDDPPLVGKTLFGYAREKVDMSQVLLGNRYLERQTGMFLVAPSGVGKSTAVIQMAALWSAKLPAFRIPPSSDLGTIIFQSEDSSNDLIEMCRTIDYLGLTREQMALVDRNCWIETVKGKLGKSAVNRFRQVIAKRKEAGQKVDLIIINPYTAYLAGDVQDPEPNNEFLRALIDPLLCEFSIAALVVHHTPKINKLDTSKWEFWDWMYSGAGSAAITNWARAFIAIEPVRKTAQFRFIAAKRGDRLEWDKREIFCVHDQRPGVLLWNEVDEAAVQAAKASARRSMSFEELFKMVPVLDAIPKATLKEKAANAGYNRDSYRAVLDDALVNGRLYVWYLENKPARSIIAIGRHPQPQDNGELPFPAPSPPSS